MARILGPKGEEFFVLPPPPPHHAMASAQVRDETSERAGMGFAIVSGGIILWFDNCSTTVSHFFSVSGIFRVFSFCSKIGWNQVRRNCTGQEV